MESFFVLEVEIAASDDAILCVPIDPRYTAHSVGCSRSRVDPTFQTEVLPVSSGQVFYVSSERGWKEPFMMQAIVSLNAKEIGLTGVSMVDDYIPAGEVKLSCGACCGARAKKTRDETREKEENRSALQTYIIEQRSYIWTQVCDLSNQFCPFGALVHCTINPSNSGLCIILPLYWAVQGLKFSRHLRDGVCPKSYGLTKQEKW